MAARAGVALTRAALQIPVPAHSTVSAVIVRAPNQTMTLTTQLHRINDGEFRTARRMQYLRIARNMTTPTRQIAMIKAHVRVKLRRDPRWRRQGGSAPCPVTRHAGNRSTCGGGLRLTYPKHTGSG